MSGVITTPLSLKKSGLANENGDLNLLEGKCTANEAEIMKVFKALEKYFPSWGGYNMAKCGGCIRKWIIQKSTGASPQKHQLDFEQCAIDAGLGERGLSGSILTDEFGPCIRRVFIQTDTAFTPDPVVTPHLCDKCGSCIAACPGKAIATDGKRDNWQCSVYYNGANRSKKPLPDAFADDPERLAIIAGEAELSPERARAILDQIVFYPPVKHAYRSSICGKALLYPSGRKQANLPESSNPLSANGKKWKLSLED